MKRLALAVLLLTAAPALAHGGTTCSAPKSTWKPQAELVSMLVKQGWKVRKAHIENGCYEVYGTTPEGDRVEAFFDPATHAKLMVMRRGEVLFKKVP